MLEVGYVGTSGNRLLTASNINAALPGTTGPDNSPAVRARAGRDPRALQ